MIRYLPPFAFFVSLIILFVFGLGDDPRLLPSPLIDKPAPHFNLPTLTNPETRLKTSDLKGQVSLLNVWASWCVACRSEHPLLVAATNNHQFNLYGLNYKDERHNATQWLQKLGNPYIESGFDQQGIVGIDYGVYGVPETFVLDKNGIIRYKHVGPLTQQQLETVIMPLIKQLTQQ